MIDPVSIAGRRRAHRELIRLMVALENPGAKAIQKILRRQWKRTASEVERGIFTVSGAVDSQSSALRDTLRRHLVRVAQAALQVWERGWQESQKNVSNFNRKAEETFREIFWGNTGQWVRSHAAEKVQKVDERTKAQLRDVINKAILQGKSDAEIARVIRELSPIRNAPRSRVIARTETHTALSRSLDTAAKGTGVDMERVWSATIDKRTRPSHAAADGQTRGQEEPFDVGMSKLMYPGDPNGAAQEIIQCRCILFYHVKEVQKPVVEPAPVVTPPAETPTLTEAQQGTLNYIRELGKLDDVALRFLGHTPVGLDDTIDDYFTRDELHALSDQVTADIKNGRIPLQMNTNMGKDSAAYNDLLENGRFKNQFELGKAATSQGNLSPVKDGPRDIWEKRLSGNNLSASPEYQKLRKGKNLPADLARERPVYGYLGDSDPQLRYLNGDYGNITFRFRPEVSARTSFSIFNSSMVSSNPKWEVGTPENNAALLRKTLKTIRGGKEKAYFKKLKLYSKGKGEVPEHLLQTGRDYTEVQYYGDLTLKDVAEIHIPKAKDGEDPYDYMVELARKWDIKVVRY